MSIRMTVVVCGGILIATGLLISGRWAHSEEEAGPALPSHREENPVRPRPGGPQVVRIGCYLLNVESIDLSNNTYYLSFVLWMKWKGSIDPTKSFRIVNLVDEWGLTKAAAFEKPILLPDGHKYQRFSVEGKFYHKFWLKTFPLDWQKVTLEVEDRIHSSKQLVYVPDQSKSGVDSRLAIPGWKIIEVYNIGSEVDYGTDFGREGGQSKSGFPHYRFGLKIERPVSYYFFKIIPPILITLLCCLMIFYVSPSMGDFRLGTPIAALLTEVFLQLTFTSNLPNTGTVFLIDHVFNLSYLMILAMLVVCIYTNRLYGRTEDLRESLSGADDVSGKARICNEIDLLEARLAKIDRRARLILSGSFLAGVVAITLLVRGSYFFEMFRH